MNSQEYHNARCGLPDKKDELLACPVERGERAISGLLIAALSFYEKLPKED